MNRRQQFGPRASSRALPLSVLLPSWFNEVLPAAATPRCIMGPSPFPRGATVALNDVDPSVQVKSAAPSLSRSPRQLRLPLLPLLLLLFQQSPLNVPPTCGRLGDDSAAPSRRRSGCLRGWGDATSEGRIKPGENEAEIEAELQRCSSA